MVDEIDDDIDAENEDEEATDEEGAKSKKKKMQLIIVGAALVLLLISGGALAYFLGVFGGSGDGPVADTPSVYFDMPEMVVNLSAGRDHAQYLKLKIAIEAKSQDDIDALQPKMPRIQDMFLVYLREMRRQDLEGSAAVYRLKQELMRRINIAIYPASIKRVLFREIIIQ